MSERDLLWRGPGGTFATLVFFVLLILGIALVFFRPSAVADQYGPHADFPAIRDWQSLQIRLTRTACFGECPDYVVEIRGDGSVVYEGRECVAVKGRREAKISQATLEKLVQHFRDADYFSLKDRYAAMVTDNPYYSTSIAFDGRSKGVEDYVGESVGMPKALSALEDEIDKVAGTDRWVYGNWIKGTQRTCFNRAVDDTWRRQHSSHP